jgi:hypothetical protein
MRKLTGVLRPNGSKPAELKKMSQMEHREIGVIVGGGFDGDIVMFLRVTGSPVAISLNANRSWSDVARMNSFYVRPYEHDTIVLNTPIEEEL